MFRLRISSILVKSLVLPLLFAALGTTAETPQEHVHRMSHQVMPFETSKTIHIFKMTEIGGVQQVIALDSSETGQVALIRRHLKHEAEKFRHGDYSDPARLHGSDMPGLEELQAGASAVEVSYSAIPSGGQISFKTGNLKLLTAIHRWFGAQLSEHGADARAE